MTLVDSSLRVQKTLGKKEKLFIKSSFSFSHRVFKRLVLQTSKNQGLFEKGLIEKDQLINSALYVSDLFALAENKSNVAK